MQVQYTQFKYHLQFFEWSATDCPNFFSQSHIQIIANFFINNSFRLVLFSFDSFSFINYGKHNFGAFENQNKTFAFEISIIIALIGMLCVLVVSKFMFWSGFNLNTDLQIDSIWNTFLRLKRKNDSFMELLAKQL